MFFFFFNDTATTEIYTLSLHDALPISLRRSPPARYRPGIGCPRRPSRGRRRTSRSEEHTSELQSRLHLVCRLLLEKKKLQLVRGLPPATITSFSTAVACKRQESRAPPL